MRNLHKPVVHYVRQMISRQTVLRFPEHLVVQCRGMDFHLAPNHILHMYCLIFRNSESYNPVVVFIYSALCFLFAHMKGIVQRVPYLIVIGKCFSFFLVFFSQEFQAFGAVKSIVGISLFNKLFCILPVEVFSQALPVRSVRMSLRRFYGYCPIGKDALVGHNAAPIKRFYNISFGSGNKALRVGVFYSQDKITAVLFGKKVIE